MLFRAPLERRAGGRRRKSATTGVVDEPVFERLRQLRTSLARARGVPPYVIFHDSTLRELSRRRPTTMAELLEIPGIGERKAEVYGSDLLKTLSGSL